MKKMILIFLLIGLILFGGLYYQHFDRQIKNAIHLPEAASVEHKKNQKVIDKIVVPITVQTKTKQVSEAEFRNEEVKLKEIIRIRQKLYMENFKVKNQIVNIENHYIDKEKGLIQPYQSINEEDVGWSPTELPYFDDPIEPINYYYPIEFLGFKDIMLGVGDGLIKEFKLKTANQENSMIYGKCKQQESQYNLFIHCYNGADGYLNLVMEKESKNITGNFSYFGRNEIIKTKNGKGYIYGVYK